VSGSEDGGIYFWDLLEVTTTTTSTADR